MAALIRSNTSTLLRNIQRSIRLLSTSPKKSDTASIQATQTPVSNETIDFSIEAVKKSKTWVSYGFDYHDKEWDRQVMRGLMFMTVTICLVTGGFFWSYLPDLKLLEWSQREAYLVLRSREQAGLPPISPDLVDPDTVILPTEEELGDTDIII